MQLLYDEVRKCRPICLETLDAVTEYTAKVSDTVIDICAAAMPKLVAVMKELSRQVDSASTKTFGNHSVNSSPLLGSWF